MEPLELRPDESEFLVVLESAPAQPAAPSLEPPPQELEIGPPVAAGLDPALLESDPAPPAEAGPGPAPPESIPLPPAAPPELELSSEITLEETEPLEEIEPVKGLDLKPSSACPPDQALATQAEASLKGGRRPLLALAVAAVAGTLVGAGLMGLVRQGEIEGLEDRLAAAGRELQDLSQTKQKLGAMKKELALVQDEIKLLEGADYPAGSIPMTLTAAAVLEYRTAEALLRQQVTALESGAGLAVSARATAPDPKLAAAVEGEMERLKARLEELRQGAQGLAEEPRSLVQTAIATEELNLAILNRNRLIARYGLSAPLPPQGPGP